ERELPEGMRQPVSGREDIRNLLAYASQEGWVAEIDYAARPGETAKRLRLAVEEVNWTTAYAFCYQSESQRTFELKRIQMARLTGESVEDEDDENEPLF